LIKAVQMIDFRPRDQNVRDRYQYFPRPRPGPRLRDRDKNIQIKSNQIY